MVEEASLQPYIIIVKQLMADSEMGHFKDTAVKDMSRSGHAGKGGPTTSMRRTSKQAWLDHRTRFLLGFEGNLWLSEGSWNLYL